MPCSTASSTKRSEPTALEPIPRRLTRRRVCPRATASRKLDMAGELLEDGAARPQGAGLRERRNARYWSSSSSSSAVRSSTANASRACAARPCRRTAAGSLPSPSTSRRAPHRPRPDGEHVGRRPADLPRLELAQVGVRDRLVRGLFHLAQRESPGCAQVGEEAAELVRALARARAPRAGCGCLLTPRSMARLA